MNYSTTAWANGPDPESFITVGKKRKKQKDGLVYFRDGEEFEIELFNPRTESILAKVAINGESIHEGGIVVKPGQRIFLERFIDTSKKFRFSTYFIDGKDGRAVEATRLNGKVSIEFYKQKWTLNLNGTTTFGPGTFLGTGTTVGWKTWYPHYSTTPNLNFATNGIQFYSTATPNLLLDSVSSYASSKVETGRVEKGGESKQTFSSDHTEFESSSFCSVEWRLLPESIKPIEITDFKKYCPSCGAKIKKDSYKYCPHCGNYLD